ncbi:SDR family NAD(P)-dependent oxidoreductase, partial [Microbacterium sp. CPCC 204701]|uniref:SDR family NAD(P)-dependent oxidoreductase n=1 Tax=Microbacterium sp. CPCC 204701 TaxID=2493084 RepID=UPI000FD92DBB
MAIHLITGAGSGIGEALAQRLAGRGDEVWLLARDAGRAAQLRERFPGAQTLVGDLAEPTRLSWAFGQQSAPPRLDSLLHVAGVV